jgi:hypothetical protein
MLLPKIIDDPDNQPQAGTTPERRGLCQMTRKTEKAIDEAIEESFPASDPPAFVGSGASNKRPSPAGPHGKASQGNPGKTPGAGALPDDDDKEVTPGTG